MEAAEGKERIVATFLMLGGIFTTIYAAGAVVSFIVDGHLQNALKRRMLKNQIEKLQDHFIVVGFGRMGRALCGEFAEKGQDFVLIERNPERVERAEGLGYLVIEGDAHDEDNYENAGIQRAHGLASCLPNDADNVYVTLTARGFSSSLTIVARTEDMRVHTKLLRAGADRVVCPPVLSASKVVSLMISPTHDTGEYGGETDRTVPVEIIEVPAKEFPKLIDRPLAENHVRTRTGVTVIAVDRGEKRELNPTALYSPLCGDILILAGTRSGFEQMRIQYG